MAKLPYADLGKDWQTINLKQQPIFKLQAKTKWGKGDILPQCYTENTNYLVHDEMYTELNSSTREPKVTVTSLSVCFGLFCPVWQHGGKEIPLSGIKIQTYLKTRNIIVQLHTFLDPLWMLQFLQETFLLSQWSAAPHVKQRSGSHSRTAR